MYPDNLERVLVIEKCVCMIWKVSKHIWTMLMHKIWQTHLLRAVVGNLKIYDLRALSRKFLRQNSCYPESFHFSDSGSLESCAVVECKVFEKENLWALDSKKEFILYNQSEHNKE